MALNKNNRAPTTIFFQSALSPRQIANKAITLGCKKLDRDDKRSRPRYDVRERLLLCNTIAKAEELLNKRTRRTNRRVMAAEDEEGEDSFNESKNHQPHSYHSQESHSPLRSSADDDGYNDSDNSNDRTNPKDDKALPSIPSPPPSSLQQPPCPASFPLPESMLPRDCRRIVSDNVRSTPIATII
ncbi:hypothetical protein EC973_003460 [Apophysomyces ossiformis]|uniref:Uncharacterized protein n=1 Tax=Apophysomyces ossiformis TaxID=679940 RepID=A0A8H7EMD3_9FUNG|nr:hypothetical protein EC973_003460 [Apophysomyces ossiformis]